MTIPRSTSSIFWLSSLVACASVACADDATTGHGAALDGAVARQQPIAGDGEAAPPAGLQGPQLSDEPAPDEPGRLSGVALAGSIAGIRAFVANLHGEPLEHGPVRVLEQAGSVLALAEVEDAALDAESRAWRGRAVRVLTSAHQTCTGRVAALELATTWVPREELFELGARPSSAEIGTALGSMFSSVVAHVVLDGPEPCRGSPLLIEDAAQPSARVAHPLRSVPRQRKVLEAFRNLPRYRQLHAECVQHGECSEDPQTGVVTERPVELRAFQFPNDSSVYVTVSLAGISCSDWGDPLSAIFVLDPRGAQPTLYRVNEGRELGAPLLMLGSGGDGGLQLVGYRLVGDLELVDEQGDSRQLWPTHFMGCPC